MSYPSYPGQGQPGGQPQYGGYPQQQQQAAGYPQQAGYPYPGQAPAQAGYPSQQMAGYPPQQGGGYPGAAPPPSGPIVGGYPPQQQQAYPPQAAPQPYLQQPQMGYPPQQGSPQPQGYPAQPHSGYPTQPQAGGYPVQAQGYPPQQQGYPQQQHFAPPAQQYQQGGFPPQAGAQPAYGQPYGHAPGAYSNTGVPPAQAYGQQQAMQQPGHGGGGGGGVPMQQGQGTVRPFGAFNANQDAEVLRKAMKGFGCDSSAVMSVLCCRSNQQRLQIVTMFKTMYGKDLIKELISELSGNFEDVIVALLYPAANYDAMQLRRAMEGAGTKESVLIEIMCTRTNAEILAVKSAYKLLYGRDLERDLKSETSFHFQRLLVSMSTGGRDESGRVDNNRAVQDAQALWQAGQKKWGTDESTFNAILASQNFNQLRQVFQEYQKMAGHDIEQAVRREFSGDIEDGMLAVVKCAKGRPAYFAERLNASMRGMGTDDNTLIRVVVTRCEVDMVQIKNEYQRMYGKALDAAIKSDTSGKYKEALLMLVRGM